MNRERPHHNASPNRRTYLRRGAVMVITLLAVLLLAGLLAYVLNLGWQTNARVVTQNSADAAAAAGSGWVARSLNTVAMNNVGMARMVALVDVLDSMPMTVAFTLEDQNAAVTSMDRQLAASIPDSWVRDGLRNLRTEVGNEIDVLTPLDNLFNHSSYDVTRMTFFEGPAGRGQIWVAMQSLDEFSQASMENLGPLAQTAASTGGQADLTASAESNALLVPVAPAVPWKRGTFDDFQRPVMNGLLPIGVDDKTTNRGPYDTLFGWRDAYRDHPGPFSPQPGNGIVIGGHGSVPIGSGVSPPPTQQGASPHPHYTVYGPRAWMLRRMDSFNAGQLRQSRFSWWLRRMANNKIEHVWPTVGHDDVHDPQWITSFEEAVSIGESTPARVRTTAFAVVEIKSRYKRTDPRFMSEGSWAYSHENGVSNPRIARMNGWQDPRRWNVDQVADYIWRDTWEYPVTFDSELGMQFQVDAQGRPVTQTVYRIDEFTFLGIDVGLDVPVPNPFNFTDRTQLPAPIDMDHTQVKTDEDSRWEYLTYMGIARHDDEPLAWPHKFEGNKPYPNMVALAQSHVFNNHSWDLWTQMWHAQLEPLSAPRFGQWIDRLESGSGGAAPDATGLSPEELAGLTQYLRSVEPLAPVMMNH